MSDTVFKIGLLVSLTSFAMLTTPLCGQHPPSYVGELQSSGCGVDQPGGTHVLVQVGEIRRATTRLDTGPLCGILSAKSDVSGWVIPEQPCISVAEASISMSKVTGTFTLTRDNDGGTNNDLARVQIVLDDNGCTRQLEGTLKRWHRGRK